MRGGPSGSGGRIALAVGEWRAGAGAVWGGRAGAAAVGGGPGAGPGAAALGGGQGQSQARGGGGGGGRVAPSSWLAGEVTEEREKALSSSLKTRFLFLAWALLEVRKPS